MSVDLSATLWKLFAVAALVFANGFFVAAEFALVSIRRTRVEELVAQGVRVAKVVQRAVHDLDRYIAGTQVGITLASLALGWIGEPALAHLIEPFFGWVPLGASKAVAHSIAITLAFATITFLHVVLGELVPKSLALQKPEQTSLWVARPMAFVVVLFQPLIWVLNGFGNMLLRWIGLQAAGEHHGVHSVEELQLLVGQSHEAGVLDDLERQMLQRTFRFSELVVSDVMIPRHDIVAFDVTTPTEELLDKVARSIHTRLPVYEDTIEHIIGFLHVHDLFKHTRQSLSTLDLRKLVRPSLFVPETIHLDALLEQFRQRHTQIAIVVDEHGGTAGLITLEDVIEEVFGELQDTLEAEQPNIQTMPDGRVLVRGDVHLHELNGRLGWNLPEDEADTIAGYVMACLGRTARVGDVVETPHGMIRVENMARLRITQVAFMPKLSETDPSS